MTDLVKFPDAVEAKWSSGEPTLATSGGIFLEGDIWGAWEGRLAVATLAGERLWIFEFNDSDVLVSKMSASDLGTTYGRLRTPIIGPDSALYLTTSNSSGVDRILRVTPKQPPSFETDSLSLNPPIGLWWARGSRVGGGLGWRRVVGGVNRPGLVCLGVFG